MTTRNYSLWVLAGFWLCSACGGSSAPNVLDSIFDDDPANEKAGAEPRAPESEDAEFDTTFDAGLLVTRSLTMPLFEVVASLNLTTQQIENRTKTYANQVFRPIASYPFVSNGNNDPKELIAPVDPRTIVVKVNDKPYGSANWSYDPQSNLFSFINHPPAGASVGITHRVADRELKTKFNFDDAPRTYENVTIYVDDTIATGATYDSPSATVTFAVAPLDDAQIALDFLVDYAPILGYSHNFDPAQLDYPVAAYYKESGQNIEVSIDAEEVRLDPLGFAPDAEVVVNLVDGSRATERLVISEYVEPGSIVVENSSTLCRTGSIEIFANGIDLSNCQIDDLTAVVIVSYKTKN